MNITKAAGGVVVNDEGKIVIVSSRMDSWSFPKGHIDPGEDALTAAKREIYEESGITELEYVKELGSFERYHIELGKEVLEKMLPN
jgi:8-oxo-dGTP pyrophosphatase MutT (NUDIX family)